MKHVALGFLSLVLALALLITPTQAHHRPGHKPTPPPTGTPRPTATASPRPTASPVPTPSPAPTPSAAPTPSPAPAGSCTFIESQAWWMQTPGKTGTDFGHLHVGSCVPYKQVVSGVLTFDVRLIMHNNPGSFDYLNPVLKTDSQELSLPHVTAGVQGMTCPTGTCERHVTLSVDTRLSNYDGVQEIRIRTYVRESDGNIMHASLNMLVNVQNGDPENPIDRKAYERFKGWYTVSGYCEASLLSDVPLAPVSSWHPVVQALNHGASDDLAVSRYSVRLDADNHAGIPGTILASGNGQLQPTTLNISGLAPGTHKLSIRAECDDPRGSTNVGVGVIEFKVP